MSHFISIILLATFFFTNSTTPIHAQTLDPDLDLTVFPPTAYLVVKPGTEITHRVLLKYDGKVAVKVITDPSSATEPLEALSETVGADSASIIPMNSSAALE